VLHATVTAALVWLSCESPKKAPIHHLCTIHGISTVQTKHYHGNTCISTISQKLAIVGSHANVHPRCSMLTFQALLHKLTVAHLMKMSFASNRTLKSLPC